MSEKSLNKIVKMVRQLSSVERPLVKMFVVDLFCILCCLLFRLEALFCNLLLGRVVLELKYCCMVSMAPYRFFLLVFQLSAYMNIVLTSTLLHS